MVLRVLTALTAPPLRSQQAALTAQAHEIAREIAREIALRATKGRPLARGDGRSAYEGIRRQDGDHTLDPRGCARWHVLHAAEEDGGDIMDARLNNFRTI